jgi:hypothetical protein
MPRRDKRQPLAVRVSYETSRLAGHNMADAFERLLPTTERQVRPPCDGESEARRDRAGQTRRP